ncbi:GNAT family N-acetyltransferase [Pseudofrankia sp. BMG5.36]|uniref:GNAT family N-acetyltransferase n=1 Tax=Pseudofrankia sp. BMG5.36 TaxID=1834512 RepID=UPI0008D926F8|nr:GNAT family N-acetyltransferase [Pseudofrankia sp. BMG5.36]OHV44371.1 GCN5 family acetyltransferase [Pseudofrankia sp. BMG5.36]
MLQTERLSLRPLRVDDVDAYVSLHAHEQVSRFLGPYSRSQALDRLTAIERQWAERGHGRCAVELRSTGELIGVSGLQHWESFDEVEIGWTLRPDRWGHGYATEAAGAWLDWGFRNLPDPYFTAMIRPANVRSIRVAERLGFHHLRADTLFDRPTTVYALPRPERRNGEVS